MITASSSRPIGDPSELQPGFYVPRAGAPGFYAASYVAVSVLYLARFVVALPWSISSMVVSVLTAATADDPCDVGIYDATADPLTLVSHAGSTSGKLNAVGNQSFPLLAPASLSAARVYYAALFYSAVGGSAASLAALVSNVAAPGYALFGSTPPAVEGAYCTPGGSVCPSTIACATTTALTGSIPLLALHT